MKWLLRCAMWCYPAVWRARYGDELLALIEDAPGTWTNVVDVIRGGMTMRLTRSRLLAPTGACAAIGLAIGMAIAISTPLEYGSTATMRVRSAETFPLDSQLHNFLTTTLSTADTRPEQIRVNLISTSIFQLSVIDTDPGKSQEVTRRLAQQLVGAKHNGAFNVEVLDDPRYQKEPVGTRRVTVAGAGLVAGGLCGMLLGLFRSRRPAGQV